MAVCTLFKKRVHYNHIFQAGNLQLELTSTFDPDRMYFEMFAKTCNKNAENLVFLGKITVFCIPATKSRGLRAHDCRIQISSHPGFPGHVPGILKMVVL